MTYGEEQEAASAALLGLLDDAAPAPDSADAVLALRHQVHLALLERVELMGASRHLDQPKRSTWQLDTVRHPLHSLERIVRALPAGESGDAQPSAVLAAGAADPSVELWRGVARHLALANAELRGAPPETWLQRPQTWYLLGDLATTVESLVVLEERLGRAGVIPQMSQNAYLHHRLAAGDVSRIAGWLGTDSSSDLAYQSPADFLAVGGGPRIQLIRRPEDYARAQRALAGFMRPRNSFDPNQAETERPGLLAARTIGQGQVRLAEVFATWADRGGEPDLASSFRARIPLYVELHRSTMRLVELQPTRSPLVVAQQSEMVQRARTLIGARMTSASLQDLERSTGILSVSVGKALRREGKHRQHLLVRDEERLDLKGARPINNSRDPFVVACRALLQSGATSSSLRGVTPTNRRRRLGEQVRSMALDLKP